MKMVEVMLLALSACRLTTYLQLQTRMIALTTNFGVLLQLTSMTMLMTTFIAPRSQLLATLHSLHPLQVWKELLTTQTDFVCVAVRLRRALRQCCFVAKVGP